MLLALYRLAVNILLVPDVLSVMFIVVLCYIFLCFFSGGGGGGGGVPSL